MRRRRALRMRALLVVASGCAFVVPRRGLAQRPQRRRPVAKGFYDEDDEHDEEPRPWADAELGGVRLQRLAAMTGVGAAAYTTYILGSEALVLACSFYLLESFVDDLEDPFGGSWTVDAALDACDELVDALAVEE